MQEALVFDREHTDRFNKRRKEFLERLLPALMKECRIETGLDVGCGIGYFADYLLQLGLAVTAFDARPQNITHAMSRYSGVNFLVHDLEDRSVRDLGRYDLVLCFGLLYHLENPFLAIRNLSALTRNVLIVESIVASTHDPVAWLVDEGEGEDQGLQYIALIPSEKSIVKMLYRAGFSQVYRVTALPDHEDFRDRLFQKRRRTIIVASNLSVDSPLLQLVPEPRVREQQLRSGMLTKAMQVGRSILRGDRNSTSQ
jgi:SAM-dependent methyltransferase